ncbi:hypothetical protein Hypma_003117 [Hypsizygus marmoreus]|uniref:Uncharacterized protein n=1 Tax=Hypsizygus marmoreus TaxID=39966 RepID=A0A369J731_HYPMA|nr:hypothetical protein Hypma_003117 [Hypsizygus marmoreus]
MSLNPGEMNHDICGVPAHLIPFLQEFVVSQWSSSPSSLAVPFTVTITSLYRPHPSSSSVAFRIHIPTSPPAHCPAHLPPSPTPA